MTERWIPDRERWICVGFVGFPIRRVGFVGFPIRCVGFVGFPFGCVGLRWIPNRERWTTLDSRLGALDSRPALPPLPSPSFLFLPPSPSLSSLLFLLFPLPPLRGGEKFLALDSIWSVGFPIGSVGLRWIPDQERWIRALDCVGLRWIPD